MWQIEHVDGKRWKCTYLKEHSDGYLTLSGSDDTINLDVPFPFRLVRIEVTFDDATAKNLDIYFIPRGYKSPNPPRVYSGSAETTKDYILEFSVGYEKESAIVRFKVNGTVSKKMFPVVYIQEM